MQHAAQCMCDQYCLAHLQLHVHGNRCIFRCAQGGFPHPNHTTLSLHSTRNFLNVRFTNHEPLGNAKCCVAAKARLFGEPSKICCGPQRLVSRSVINKSMDSAAAGPISQATLQFYFLKPQKKQRWKDRSQRFLQSPLHFILQKRRDELRL